MTRSLSLTVIALLIAQQEARPQSIGFSLPKVNGANAYASLSVFAPKGPVKDSDGVMPGWGFEATFTASKPTPSYPCEVDANEMADEDVPGECLMPFDLASQRRKISRGGVDHSVKSVCRVTLSCRKKATPADWQAQVALGYHQSNLDGDLNSDLSLTAAIRVFPTIVAYLVYRNGGYIGLGTGLASLSQARLYTKAEADSAVGDLAGDTLEIAGYAGWTFKKYLFVEAAYHLQYFPSVTYRLPGLNTAPGGTAVLPEALPRTLNLSTLAFSAGLILPLE